MTRVTWVGGRNSLAVVLALLPLVGFQNAPVSGLEAKELENYFNTDGDGLRAVEGFIRRYLTCAWSPHVVRFVHVNNKLEEDEESGERRVEVFKCEFVKSAMTDFLPPSLRPAPKRIQMVGYDFPDNPAYNCKVEVKLKAPHGQSWSLSQLDELMLKVAGFEYVVTKTLGLYLHGLHGSQLGEQYDLDAKINGPHYGHRLGEVVWYAARLGQLDGVSNRVGLKRYRHLAGELLACRPLSSPNLTQRMRRLGPIDWGGPKNDIMRVPITKEVVRAWRMQGVLIPRGILGVRIF